VEKAILVLFLFMTLFIPATAVSAEEVVPTTPSNIPVAELDDVITSLNKIMFSPFFSLFRMISSLTSKAPLDRI
jgi:hypothetical protein